MLEADQHATPKRDQGLILRKHPVLHNSAIMANRRNNQLALTGGAAAGSIMGNMVFNPQMRAVLRELVQAVRQSQSDSRAPKQPRKRRGRGNSAADNAAVGRGTVMSMKGTAISKSGHSPGYRFTTQFLVSVDTDVSGNTQNGLRLATDDPALVLTTLATHCSRCAALRDLYRHVKIHKVKVRYVPSQSDNASGTVGLCVDADTMTTGYWNMVAIARKDHAFITGVTTPAGLTWTPRGTKEREYKATRVGAAGGVVRTQDDLASSSIIWNSQTDVPGKSIGYLVFEVDVEFEDAV